MNLETRIRMATEEDEAALVAFNLAMAHETEEKRLAPEVVLAGVRGVLQHPHRGFYLVAERGVGGPVASLLVTREWSDWRNGNFWWIQSVYVLPEHRRKGVFRTFYETLRRVARSKPRCCGLRLYVDRENEIAQRTYAALGMDGSRYRFLEDLLG